LPHYSIDPIVIGSEIVMSLQTIVSRNVAPGDFAVISLGKFQSGVTANVIPEKAELEATVRSISEATRHLLEERIKAIIDHTKKANGATYKLDYTHSYPAIQNDPKFVSLAKSSAAGIIGQDKVMDILLMPASEDFSCYNNVAPECFVLLGGGPGPANHNPRFNPDEGALVVGVKTEVQIILNYLNQE
jgi:amidohydrolase